MSIFYRYFYRNARAWLRHVCVVMLCLASSYLVLTASPVMAEKVVEIPPEDVVVTTPVYHPQFGKIEYPLGTYKYTVSWQGIPAADAAITVNQEGLFYKIKAVAKTYSGIDLFYKLRYAASGKISMVDFLPVETVIDHQENSKKKKVDIRYLDNGDISAVRSQAGKNTKSITFDPKNFTLEPISAGFIARGLEWNVGKKITLDTFNGKTRYLVHLECVDRKTIEVNDEERDVWVISPSVQKLTTTDKDSKLRTAYIYLTADKYREVLQIDSEVFIGTVKTKLDSFEPLPQGAGTQVVAQAKSYKLQF